MGESHRVGPGEGYQLARGESSLSEQREKIRYRGIREREMAVHGGGGGDEAVFATEAERVVGPTDHNEQIAGCDGEHVGAGDDARARDLEGGLGAHDGVEGVAWERVIDVGVALRSFEGGGGNEDRGVAAVEKAIVEEETESAGGGSGRGDLLVDDCVGDDL